MATTTELREKRANTWQQMQDLVNLAEREDRDFTAEERATYSRMESDLDALGDRAERIERMEALNSRLSQPSGRPEGLFGEPADERGDEQYAEAFSTFVRRGMAQANPEQQASLQPTRS